MRKPKPPPPFNELVRRSAVSDRDRFAFLVDLSGRQAPPRDYPHWDVLRRLPPPEGITAEEWWLVLKLQRLPVLRPLPLLDRAGEPFRFTVPDTVQEQLHHIDMGAAGTIGIPQPVTNPQARDQYYVRSLIQEAITSSQLEGAVTTREVAKEMIRTGRRPRDRSERMILNNYLTMQRVSDIKAEPLSADLVFGIHRLVTDQTLDEEDAAGRLRRLDERRVVASMEGEVFHEPPPAEQLPERLEAMCAFANGRTPNYFVHPVVRAIILHFWVAHDHPFVDGNGRTARALFYWAMLHRGFWLFEFISISGILLRAPVQYARSFLHTETDDNDVTYFLVAQSDVIRRALEELHSYIDRKSQEVQALESQLHGLTALNHRQVALITNALKHPHQSYTIASHQESHRVAYQTARTDLLDLHQRGLLEMKKRGKAFAFTVLSNLSERLEQLERE